MVMYQQSCFSELKYPLQQFRTTHSCNFIDQLINILAVVFLFQFFSLLARCSSIAERNSEQVLQCLLASSVYEFITHGGMPKTG